MSDHVFHWKHGWIPVDGSGKEINFSSGSPQSKAVLGQMKAQADKLGPHSHAAAAYQKYAAKAPSGPAKPSEPSAPSASSAPSKPASSAEKIAAKVAPSGGKNKAFLASMANKQNAKRDDKKAAPAAPPKASAPAAPAKTSAPATKPAAPPKPAVDTAPTTVNRPAKPSAQAHADKATAAPPAPAPKAAAKPEPVTGTRELSKAELHASLAGANNTQRSALADYTGKSGVARGVNTGLRDNALPSQFTGTVKQMDDALGKSPIPAATKVYRTVGIDTFGLKEGQSPKALEGGTFGDKGFMSTSLEDIRFTESQPRPITNIHITYEVPKGIGGVYLAPISKYPEEEELLLQRNLKYVISDVKKGKGGWVATARILPSDAAA